MVNMAYCCLILLGKAIQKLVFGKLRVIENQVSLLFPTAKRAAPFTRNTLVFTSSVRVFFFRMRKRKNDRADLKHCTRAINTVLVQSMFCARSSPKGAAAALGAINHQEYVFVCVHC